MPTGMLPNDLILNILSFQSVKCLLRFRCLSKLFCNLIDSQEFIKIHLKRSIETDYNLSLILSGSKRTIVACSRYWECKIFSSSLDSLDIAVELDHPFKNSKGETLIIDSCNGLIALRNSENDIALWNPSTKKHLILPQFPSDFKYDNFLDGFGYDAANDDYKFVRVGISCSKAAVYSLKINSWRLVRIDLPYFLPYSYDGTFADGRVHWLGGKTHENKSTALIITFDLKNEELHEMPFPPLENKSSIILMYLGSFKGCLYFSCLFTYGKPIDIWVLKESWIKSFSFPRRVFGDYLKLLAYSKNGEKVLVDEFDFDNCEYGDDLNKWKLYWYDLQNQTTAGQVTIHGVPQGCRNTMICVDSLVSLAVYMGRGV